MVRFTMLVLTLSLRKLLKLVAFIEPVNVFQGLAQRSWHLLVQVLVMSLVLPCPVLYELVCACLLDIVIEPRKVKLIHAEANQVQERFDVIDWSRIRM